MREGSKIGEAAVGDLHPVPEGSSGLGLLFVVGVDVLNITGVGGGPFGSSSSSDSESGGNVGFRLMKSDGSDSSLFLHTIPDVDSGGFRLIKSKGNSSSLLYHLIFDDGNG